MDNFALYSRRCFWSIENKWNLMSFKCVERMNFCHRPHFLFQFRFFSCFYVCIESRQFSLLSHSSFHIKRNSKWSFFSSSKRQFQLFVRNQFSGKCNYVLASTIFRETKKKRNGAHRKDEKSSCDKDKERERETTTDRRYRLNGVALLASRFSFMKRKFILSSS